MAADQLQTVAVNDLNMADDEFVVFSAQHGSSARMNLSDLLDVSETRARVADDRGMAAGTDLLTSAPVAHDSVHDDLFGGHLAGTDGLI